MSLKIFTNNFIISKQFLQKKETAKNCFGGAFNHFLGKGGSSRHQSRLTNTSTRTIFHEDLINCHAKWSIAPSNFSNLSNLIQFMQDRFLVYPHSLIWQFQTHHVELTIRLYVWTSPYTGQFSSNHATERQRTGPDGCLCCFDNTSQDGDSVAPLHWNRKIGSHGQMLSKFPIISKNASIKNYPKLNFLQKPHQAHMFISPNSGARGLHNFAIPIPVHYIWKMANV